MRNYETCGVQMLRVSKVLGNISSRGDDLVQKDLLFMVNVFDFPIIAWFGVKSAGISRVPKLCSGKIYVRECSGQLMIPVHTQSKIHSRSHEKIVTHKTIVLPYDSPPRQATSVKSQQK